MKIFVAKKGKKQKIDDSNYHWCDAGEVLMFTGKPGAICMVGVESGKATTRIEVQDVDMDLKGFEAMLEQPKGLKLTAQLLALQIIAAARPFEVGDSVLIKGRKAYLK